MTIAHPKFDLKKRASTLPVEEWGEEEWGRPSVSGISP
jgi:hypothetical protein